MPNWLAALIVLLVLWGVGVTVFAVFIPLIFNKLTALASVDFASILSSFDDALLQFQHFLQQYFSFTTSTLSISDAIGQQVDRLFNADLLNRFFGSFVSGVAVR